MCHLGRHRGQWKSDAAAAYGANHRQDYDLLIWFDRDEVRRVDDLRAAPLEEAATDSRRIPQARSPASPPSFLRRGAPGRDGGA